jgi:protein-tyrosine phosphatase
MYNKINKSFKIFRSVALFHVSNLYNTIVNKSSFTFNQLADDKFEEQKKGIQIECDKDGNITKFNDGKKVPLVVGSIPKKQEHLDQLRKYFNLNNKSIIGIYTLNLKFERDWSGLTNLIENDSEIIFYKYPTIDFCAPTLIDILRIVRDLENRDCTNESIAFVQCKAGRGRSVLAVTAYLIDLLDKAKIYKTYDQIEFYIKLKRPRMKMNAEHKAALKNFKEKLKEAGGLNSLLSLYKEQIEKRDKEVVDSSF